MVEVTVLSDNTVAESRPVGLIGEWGFAAAVGDVLFDTGQSDAAYRNARLLDCESHFDTIVLSHGHQDHTGGLPGFLVDEPTVVLHPEAWTPRYNHGDHIGLPYARTKIEHEADVVEHRDPLEVSSGIWALGEIPREHPDNPAGEKPVDGTRVEDHVVDDQSLAIETDDGVGLVLGCCHAGLRNTVEYAEAVLEDDVRSIIGGTHLSGMDRADVVETADWLVEKQSVDLVAPGHCTGFEAESILRSKLDERFHSIGVGTTIEL